MLIIAAGILLVFSVGTVAVILADVHRKGWRNWIQTIFDWQTFLGGFVGFVSASGVFILGTALNDISEQRKALEAANAIGSALAYEVERMVIPLQAAKVTIAESTPDSPTLSQDCTDLGDLLRVAMDKPTPVFNASISRLVDFGDQNLALFVRFYAGYDEIKGYAVKIDATSCATEAQDVFDFFGQQIDLSIGLYDRIAKNYAIATFDEEAAPAT